MLDSSVVRLKWAIPAGARAVSLRTARLLEALRVLRLRLEAARSYAAARGPVATTAGGPRGARHVPAPALQWHQQMRRLDNQMLAPQRSLGARLVWRLARAVARHDTFPPGLGAA